MKGARVWQAAPPVPRTTQPIHRGAVAAPPRPGAAPARRPARRKRRHSLWGRFWLGFVRRLYFGAKTLFKLALCVPVLVFMVWFSYTVDRSGLFQGELAPRRIVDLMLQGYDVTNFDSMDEREVVQLYAQDVPETPQVIGVGSSRVLQFSREVIGTDSFFNMGVTGADVRDNMTSYYKMVTYGKVPDVLVWSVDPWVFYDDPMAYDERADADLYNEFLTKVLGVPTDYEEPDQVELWKALAEPAYFQGNVDYFVKNRGQDVVTDDEGNAIDFNPVQGDPYAQPTNIKRSDGSVLYETTFRDQTQDQILALAAAACTTFNSVHMEGFDAMGETAMAAFEAFIDYAHEQGTTPPGTRICTITYSPRPTCTAAFSRWKTGCGSTAPNTACRCTAATTPAASRALRSWTFLTGCTARIPASASSSPAYRLCWTPLRTVPCPTRWA